MEKTEASLEAYANHFISVQQCYQLPLSNISEEKLCGLF